MMSAREDRLLVHPETPPLKEGLIVGLTRGATLTKVQGKIGETGKA